MMWVGGPMVDGRAPSSDTAAAVTTGPLFKYRVCNLFYEMAIVGSVDQNHNQIELDRLNGKDCGIGCNLMGLGD